MDHGYKETKVFWQIVKQELLPLKKALYIQQSSRMIPLIIV
jgi:hypothetical protein